MATYKTKVKDLKNINNETDTGGAPFYGDDILRIQTNAKADFINSMEAQRRKLPVLNYYRGVNPAEVMHGTGLILSGCTYDNSTSGSVTLSPGYILSEGEICYYAGGTYTVSTLILAAFYLRKGNLLTESRVFNDGVNKEFLVSYEVEVFQSEWNTQTPTPEPLAAADLSKEYVLITAGASQTSINANYAEKSCTLDAALGVVEMGRFHTFSAFTDVSTFGSGWSLNTEVLGKMGSKVNPDGSTFITGSVKKTFAGETTPDGVITLTAENIQYSTGDLFFNVAGYDVAAAAPAVYVCKISSAGTISVYPRNGGSFPTGELKLFFNNTIVGTVNNAYNESYTYNAKFLDVTP